MAKVSHADRVSEGNVQTAGSCSRAHRLSTSHSATSLLLLHSIARPAWDTPLRTRLFVCLTAARPRGAGKRRVVSVRERTPFRRPSRHGGGRRLPQEERCRGPHDGATEAAAQGMISMPSDARTYAQGSPSVGHASARSPTRQRLSIAIDHNHIFILIHSFRISLRAQI